MEDKTGTTRKIQRVALPLLRVSCWAVDAGILERALTAVQGVRHAYVNSATEMAYIEFDPAQCELQQLELAVENAGFKVGEPSIR